MTDCMMDDANFESNIKGKTDRELIEFTSREVYRISRQYPRHLRRTQRLEYALIVLILVLASAGVLNVLDLARTIPLP